MWSVKLLRTPAAIALIALACTRGIGDAGKAHDVIHVSSPAPNQVITSPLVVRGEARGTWFFEATFPVRLLDAAGREVALTHAQAKFDWMTEDFVPFEATVEFTPPSGGGAGTLVLEKDNPSGLPENAAEIRVPVRFAP